MAFLIVSIVLNASNLILSYRDVGVEALIGYPSFEDFATAESWTEALLNVES